MYKLRFLIANLIFAAFLIGCEFDPSSGGNASSYTNDDLIKTTLKVRARTTTLANPEYIAMYDCGNARVYVTADTIIYHTRGSCSGFNIGSHRDIILDDTIIVYYSPEKSSYSTGTELVAEKIEAYSPDCLAYSGLPSTYDCGGCGGS